MNPTEEPGLHLPHRVIRRISGPVSMVYLQPPPAVFEAYRTKGLVLPSVLLFGDVHDSEDNECEDANNHKETVAIDDPAFLRELDTIAEFVPVDFFTESAATAAFAEKKTHGKGVLFDRFYQQTVRPCHDVALRSRGAYLNQCPTQRIRWHHADARFMDHKVEATVLAPFLQQFPKILQRIDRYHEIVPGTFAAFPFPRDLLSEFIVIANDIEDPKEAHVAVVTFCTDHLFDTLQDFSLEKGSRASLFLKEIAGQAIPEWREVDAWKDNAFRMLYRNPRFQKKIAALLKHLRSFHDTSVVMVYLPMMLGDRMSTTAPSEEESVRVKDRDAQALVAILRIFSNAMMEFDDLFMELYHVLRMFKQPQGSATAALVVGYMGEAHAAAIAQFLQILGYRGVRFGEAVAEDVSTDDVNRCVTVDSPVTLFQDLQRHTAARFQRNNAASRKQLANLRGYHGVLNRERAGRRTRGGRGKRSMRGVRSMRGGKRGVRGTYQKKKT